MSDRVVIPGPSAWLNNGRASVEPSPAGNPDAPPVETGGGGPHDPGMEARVANLETDVKDVKGSLQRIELVLAELRPTIAALPTKADFATMGGKLDTLTARVDGMDSRLRTAEATIADTLKTAAGKAIGPLQLPAIIVSTAAALGLLAAGYAWISHQPWFPH